MARNLESIDRIEGPRSTVDHVADRIREAVLSGHLAPGTRLKENQLAEQLGVSRIPIREALSRLEAEGFIKRVPYRGAMVARLTAEQVKESFMLRSLLEGHAAKLAAPKLSRKEVGKLRRLITQIDECARNGHEEKLPALHRVFHSTIYSQCGSAKLISWIEELYSQFPKKWTRTLRLTEPVNEYARIVDAIEAKDADLAGQLMSEHLLNGSQVQTEYYARMFAETGGGSG